MYCKYCEIFSGNTFINISQNYKTSISIKVLSSDFKVIVLETLVTPQRPHENPSIAKVSKTFVQISSIYFPAWSTTKITGNKIWTTGEGKLVFSCLSLTRILIIRMEIGTGTLSWCKCPELLLQSLDDTLAVGNVDHSELPIRLISPRIFIEGNKNVHGISILEHFIILLKPSLAPNRI